MQVARNEIYAPRGNTRAFVRVVSTEWKRAIDELQRRYEGTARGFGGKSGLNRNENNNGAYYY